MGWRRSAGPGGGPAEEVKNASSVRGSGGPPAGTAAVSIGSTEPAEGATSEIVAAGAAGGNSEQWHAQGSGSGAEVGAEWSSA